MGASYETVVLFAVIVFFGYAFSALAQFKGEPGPLRWVFQAYLFVVIGAYFVWFWSEGRRTLPMKTVGLRLLDATDRPVSRPRAALRYLLAWTMLLAPALAAWWLAPAWLALLALPFGAALLDGERRTLYDRLAGTRLVVDETGRR
jgi:uncharacterized RDD family membrane protein YckC